MSARATAPAVRLLAEAMIRHRPGSNGQKDGFFKGRFLTWPRVLLRATAHGMPAEKLARIGHTEDRYDSFHHHPQL